MSFDLEDDPAGQATGPGAARGRLRRPVGREARREPPREEVPGSMGRAPFLTRPGWLYAVGALLVAGVWLGRMNPTFGVLERAFPWHLFRAYGRGGGDFVFTWSPSTAVAITGFLALFYCVLALALPAGRARGVGAVAVSTLAFATYLPPLERTLLYAGAAVLAVAAAAVALHVEGRRGGAFLVAGIALLAAWLFVPWYAQDGATDPLGGSYAMAAVRSVADRPEHRSIGEALGEPEFAMAVSLLGLLAVAILSLLGAGGRWARWAAGVLLLVAALGPAALAYWGAAAETPKGESAWQAGLAAAAALAASRFTAFLLPLTAGLLDLGRPR